jgi:hypothetical protein
MSGGLVAKPLGNIAEKFGVQNPDSLNPIAAAIRINRWTREKAEAAAAGVIGTPGAAADSFLRGVQLVADAVIQVAKPGYETKLPDFSGGNDLDDASAA